MRSTGTPRVNIGDGALPITATLINGASAARVRPGNTGLQMVLGRGHFRLQEGLRCLDDGGHQPGYHVPFNVTVKQPDTWVIGSEAQNGVAVILYHDRVAADRSQRDVSVVLAVKYPPLTPDRCRT